MLSRYETGPPKLFSLVTMVALQSFKYSVVFFTTLSNIQTNVTLQRKFPSVYRSPLEFIEVATISAVVECDSIIIVNKSVSRNERMRPCTKRGDDSMLGIATLCQKSITQTQFYLRTIAVGGVNNCAASFMTASKDTSLYLPIPLVNFQCCIVYLQS